MCTICQAVNPFQSDCSLNTFGVPASKIETDDATGSFLPGVSNYAISVGQTFEGTLDVGDGDALEPMRFAYQIGSDAIADKLANRH